MGLLYLFGNGETAHCPPLPHIRTKIHVAALPSLNTKELGTFDTTAVKDEKAGHL
jgi:hypothetical protein